MTLGGCQKYDEFRRALASFPLHAVDDQKYPVQRAGIQTQNFHLACQGRVLSRFQTGLDSHLFILSAGAKRSSRLHGQGCAAPRGYELVSRRTEKISGRREMHEERKSDSLSFLKPNHYPALTTPAGIVVSPNPHYTSPRHVGQSRRDQSVQWFKSSGTSSRCSSTSWPSIEQSYSHPQRVWRINRTHRRVSQRT